MELVDQRGQGSDGVEQHFALRGVGLEFSMETTYIASVLRPAARPIADIGCGNGGLFATLAKHRPIGIDYLIDGLAETRRRHPGVPLVCGSATQLPLGSQTLGGITAQHVVEHIVEAEQLCLEWHRVLRPGGEVIVLTPNRQFSDPSTYSDPTHVFIYDRKDLRVLFEAKGFDVVDIRSLGLPWFRNYSRLPAFWRFRRFLIRNARIFSLIPGLRWKGQTLCLVARKPLGR